MQITKFNLVTDLQIMLSNIPDSRFYPECNTERDFIGGFYLVDLIITELKDNVICHKLECSHWWKMYL